MRKRKLQQSLGDFLAFADLAFLQAKLEYPEILAYHMQTVQLGADLRRWYNGASFAIGNLIDALDVRQCNVMRSQKSVFLSVGRMVLHGKIYQIKDLYIVRRCYDKYMYCGICDLLLWCPLK